MSKFPYQIGLLGDFSRHAEQLRTTISRRFDELGFSNADYVVLEGNDVGSRERKAPFSAIYFGKLGFNSEDEEICKALVEDSVVILPVVDDLRNFGNKVPKVIAGINGIAREGADGEYNREVAIVLEGFRLLRSERRLFISYKRSDSRRIAQQLYEEFDSRGFDVFLDTNGVPPGKDFQSVLWHRLADSDVVVLLDTPNFFESRWTTEELARANSTSVQILHILWPGKPSVDQSALSTFYHLSEDDFEGRQIGDSAMFQIATTQAIAIRVEELRARALSQRQRYLIDAFCDQARFKGLTVNVQPDRSISLETSRKRISVVPIVGVPSSVRLQEVHDINSPQTDECWALFDERGLLQEALKHFDWLNKSLPIKTVPAVTVVRQLDAESAP